MQLATTLHVHSRKRTSHSDGRAAARAYTVAIKQVEQQAILSLHRLRAQLLKFLIMQSNALRSLFYEFGMILPAGTSAAPPLRSLPGTQSC